ncbi:MAG: cysteine--tRNA ligase [Bacteriovoracaceae bacterium]|nr:cysteine--tRNA ligase [Bacteriovoracaceae bacterium]
MTTPMNLKVYNDLSHSKENFTPIEEGKLSFYSCGPTTYDFLHVGNAMALVVGDIIHRVFKALGYEVTYVRNFTDVDDKIINRAKENGVDALEHSSRFVDECLKDMDSLGMLPATHTPKVSETMPEIISMIEILIEKNFAYNHNGEVLYHVPEFKAYGQLSMKDLDSLEHGKRVEVDIHKKHPSDFVLWKPAKEGEPSWDSPWGKGRPGWHIECSAMAKKFLGETIDLHHGGIDLIFPHHENEIAQSEAANGVKFCNCWVHNQFLNFGKEKMSKSLGNVVTIRNFNETFGGEVLRQILTSAHYRSVIEWSEDSIERAIRDCERIHKFIINFEHAKKHNYSEIAPNDHLVNLGKVLPAMKKELANDFNIPGAMGQFFTMIRFVNREYLDEFGDYSSKMKMNDNVKHLITCILNFTKEATGLVHENPAELILKLNTSRKALQGSDNSNDSDIDKLVEERRAARASKDWAQADVLRDKLAEAGVVVKDNPDGTCSWNYK